MNINKTKIAIVLLVALFLLFGFRAFKLSDTLIDNKGWQDAITNLKLLNDRIDRYFKSGLNENGYDKINLDTKVFGQNLQALKQSNKFSAIDILYDNTQSIERVEAIFHQKLDLLTMFNYVNSGAIAFLKDSEHMMKHGNYSKRFELLFLRIKNSNFNELQALNAIELEIQNLITDIINLKDAPEYITLLRKANFIVSSIVQLRDIAHQNDNLNLSMHLSNIASSHNVWHENVSSMLYKYIAGVALVFLAFVAMFIYTIFKQKSSVKQLELFRTVIENDFGSVMITDSTNKITYVNKIFEKTSGYTLREIKGRYPSFLKSNLHSESYYHNMRSSMDRLTSWSSDELISRAKNGAYIYEKVKFMPFNFDGKHQGYIGLKMDRTLEANMVRELELKNEQLKEQSIIDKLTGFGNYFAMTELLNSRQDGTIISITIKNFDNLRFFYQTKVIEAMLESFANTLKLCIDTSEISADLFRFQDDEFYLWYSGEEITKDVSYIQEYFSFDQTTIMVDGRTEVLPGLKTIIGVSLSRDTPQTNRLIQSILANQQALNNSEDIYYYKENDAIELRYYKNQVTTQLIEYALANNTVIVECQGIYDSTKPIGEKATYYEVLVRIIDQSGKIRYPGEFLEVAMQTQLYTQITKKIIEHAFMLVERFPLYTFSINLSGIDIVDPKVSEFLREKLQLCSDPTRVCFEILESEDIGDYDVINAFAKDVKGYGAKISIDDFGSGYSNYYRILELDIDTIKIDGSIIKKLPFDNNAQYLVETIVNFASKQNYKTVAEFVSSQEILDEVRKFGIHYAQGFLLGKPTPVNML